jgi:hypothetical protein
MSLYPAIIRDPGDGELTPAEKRIYGCLIDNLDSGTSALRAVLRCARSCGVSRVRVMQVARKVNPEFMP